MAQETALERRAGEVVGRRGDLRVLAVLLAVAAVLRAVAVARQPGQFYPDVNGYLAVAGEPLWSLDFWAGERPWALPLLYKLLPAGDTWRVGAQVAVAVACWSALAVAAWGSVRDVRVRWAVVLGILGLSLTPPVIQWDRLLLSESLTLSLGAAVLAAWLVFARSPSREASIAVVVASAAWIFTRDSHAYLALLLLPVGAALVVAGRWRPARRSLAVFGLVAALGVLSIASTTTDQARLRRWERSLLHVYGTRVIPDPEARAWFEERGMPVSPEVVAVAPMLGRRTTPTPPEFERWFLAEGRSLYPRYLLAHPWESLTRVVDDHDEALDRQLSGYRHDETTRLFPASIERVLFLPSFAIVAVLLAGLGAAAWLLRRRGPGAVLGVAAVGLLLQAFHAALVVHGDTIELPRHAVGVSVATRLLLVLLAAFVADAALAHRRAPRAAEVQP